MPPLAERVVEGGIGPGDVTVDRYRDVQLQFRHAPQTAAGIETNRGSVALDAAEADHAALVGADADRPLALGHLDVEAQLALVGDLAQGRTDLARRALGRARDVLDADLEADRGLALRQVLVGEDEEQRSIIAIIPGVERTRTPIVPPTSVTSRSSTVNSSMRSAPGSST